MFLASVFWRVFFRWGAFIVLFWRDFFETMYVLYIYFVDGFDNFLDSKWKFMICAFFLTKKNFLSIVQLLVFGLRNIVNFGDSGNPLVRFKLKYVTFSFWVLLIRLLILFCFLSALLIFYIIFVSLILHFVMKCELISRLILFRRKMLNRYSAF